MLKWRHGRELNQQIDRLSMHIIHNIDQVKRPVFLFVQVGVEEEITVFLLHCAVCQVCRSRVKLNVKNDKHVCKIVMYRGQLKYKLQ